MFQTLLFVYFINQWIDKYGSQNLQLQQLESFQMGACVIICGKNQELMQEPQKTPIEKQDVQEIQKQLNEQIEKVQPIAQRQILLDIKNTDMNTSLTRSWKTQTKSRFYKQKPSFKSQQNAYSENTIKEPSSCFASQLLEKNTSKRYKRFKATKQQQALESKLDLHFQSSDNNVQKQNNNQNSFSQSININPKHILYLPKEGRTQNDQKLIQSTAKISTKTFINQKIEYIDGSVYIGQWKMAMRHGQGKLYWKDGSVYQGQWKENMLQGYGKLTYFNDQQYLGDFVKNQAHGKGDFLFSDGSKYSGEWISNFPQGNGTQYFTMQQKYVGIWKKGQKNGYGQLFFEDGTFYKGQFCNNQLQGEGEYCYFDKTYKGNWDHNQKSGYGVMEWTDGSRYEGQFLHDKMHGNGKFYDLNGIIYEGKWLNGKKDGAFLQHRPNGQIVKSQWYFNKPIKQMARRRTAIHSTTSSQIY